MSVGVAVNLFDGEELLPHSLATVRPLAAFVCVVCQRVSNFGRAAPPSLFATLRRLEREGLVDKTVEFDPASVPDGTFGVLHPFACEVTKREIGRAECEGRGCAYYMSMDADEFYRPDALRAALAWLDARPTVDAVACKMRCYYRSPTCELLPRDEANHVPAVYRLASGRRMAIGAGFPVLVDPTRTMSGVANVAVLDRATLEMFHMSFVRTRAGMLSKLTNVTNRANYNMSPEAFCAALDAWTPDLPPIHPHPHFQKQFTSVARCDAAFGVPELYDEPCVVFLATGAATMAELRLCLRSLRTWNPELAVYVFTDRAPVDPVGFGATVVVLPELMAYSGVGKRELMARPGTEYADAWTDFMYFKATAIERALRLHTPAGGGAWFLDCDMLVLGPMPRVPAHAAVALSPHMIPDERSGRYSGGFLWFRDASLLPVWRAAGHGSRCFEQAALEQVARAATVHELPATVNFGWWRMFEAAESHHAVAARFSLADGALLLDGAPVQSLHAHFSSEPGQNANNVRFAAWVRDLFKQCGMLGLLDEADPGAPPQPKRPRHASLRMTLREWADRGRHAVPPSELIVQASSVDAPDGAQLFPIGMAFQFVRDGHRIWDRPARDRGVLCAFNATTDQERRGHLPKNRRSIAETLAALGAPNVSLSPAEYYAALPRHRFVVSPEGNGVDCHRTYEALLAGCVPILERNEVTQRKYAGLPVLYTDDYSDLAALTADVDLEYDFAPLLVSHYAQAATIRACGDYWCTRWLGAPWRAAPTVVRVAYEGRLGNNIFQHCYARLVAQHNSVALDVPTIPGWPVDVAAPCAVADGTPVVEVRCEGPEVPVFPPPDEPRAYELRGYHQWAPLFAPQRVAEWLQLESVTNSTLACAAREIGASVGWDLVVHVRIGDTAGNADPTQHDYLPLDRAAWGRVLRSLRADFCPLGTALLLTDSPQHETVRWLATQFPRCAVQSSADPIVDWLVLYFARALLLTPSTFSFWPARLSPHVERVYQVCCGINHPHRQHAAAPLTHWWVDEPRYRYVDARRGGAVRSYAALGAMVPRRLRVAVFVSGRSRLWDALMLPQADVLFMDCDVAWFASLNEPRAPEGFPGTVACRVVSEDEYARYEKKRGDAHCNARHIVSQFAHNAAALRLVEASGAAFDAVVKWRPDIAAADVVPISECLDARPDALWVPRTHDFGGLNDQIAFGSLATMREYAGLIGRMPAYVDVHGVPLHAERLLGHHVAEARLAVERFAFKYELDKRRFE